MSTEPTELRELIDGFLRGEVFSELDLSQLPSISDMPTLISYWESTSSGSRPEQLIEARLIEVLVGVSSDDIPEWFMNILRRGIGSLPDFLCQPFREKAEKLRESLG